MRKRNLITVAVVAIVLAALGGWLHFSHQAEMRQSQSVVKNVSIQNGKNSTPPKIDQKTQAGLQMLVSAMKNMGWKEIPPIQQQLQLAINSKDTGTVIRAFHDAVTDRKLLFWG